MSSFSKEEVARLANLARIALSDEEMERLAGELSSVSNAVEQVAEVAASDVPPTSHPIPLTNVWREDEVGEGINLDEVLEMAPDARDGKFAVPQILGED